MPTQTQKPHIPTFPDNNISTNSSPNLNFKTTIPSISYIFQPKNTEKTGMVEREPFLASGVPNLSLDDLVVNTDAAGGEFNPDGGLGLEAELILGKARQEVGLANARVPYQHHLEQVVVVVLRSVRRHCFLSSIPFPVGLSINMFYAKLL
jgi:hypothetical protein